jgi:hypothetical protein
MTATILQFPIKEPDRITQRDISYAEQISQYFSEVQARLRHYYGLSDEKSLYLTSYNLRYTLECYSTNYPTWQAAKEIYDNHYLA